MRVVKFLSRNLLATTQSGRFLFIIMKNMAFVAMIERIPVYETKDGRKLFRLEDACAELKINFVGELERTESDNYLRKNLIKSSNGAHYLPEKFLFGWIAGVKSGRKDIVEYQKECADVLCNAMKGADSLRKLFGIPPVMN